MVEFWSHTYIAYFLFFVAYLRSTISIPYSTCSVIMLIYRSSFIKKNHTGKNKVWHSDFILTSQFVLRYKRQCTRSLCSIEISTPSSCVMTEIDRWKHKINEIIKFYLFPDCYVTSIICILHFNYLHSSLWCTIVYKFSKNFINRNFNFEKCIKKSYSLSFPLLFQWVLSDS